MPWGEIVVPDASGCGWRGFPGQSTRQREAQAKERMREGGREGGLSKGLHQVGDPSSQGKPHEWTDERLAREAGQWVVCFMA